MPSNWMFLVEIILHQKLQTAPDPKYPHSESVSEETRRNPRGDVEYILEVGDESGNSVKWEKPHGRSSQEGSFSESYVEGSG